MNTILNKIQQTKNPELSKHKFKKYIYYKNINYHDYNSDQHPVARNSHKVTGD
jgi:hypothetical protein